MKNNDILTKQWESPIIKNYQLKISDSYTFIASNLLFEALGITNTINLSTVKSSLFKGDFQTTLTPPTKNIYIFTAIKLTKYSTKIMGLKTIILLGCFRVTGRSNKQS